jgi:hypothetical protein
MSRVFQNIDPSPPGECVPPFALLGGEGGGGGGNILEDARHSSVLYICEYFVIPPQKKAIFVGEFAQKCLGPERLAPCNTCRRKEIITVRGQSYVSRLPKY